MESYCEIRSYFKIIVKYYPSYTDRADTRNLNTYFVSFSTIPTRRTGHTTLVYVEQPSPPLLLTVATNVAGASSAAPSTDCKKDYRNHGTVVPHKRPLLGTLRPYISANLGVLLIEYQVPSTKIFLKIIFCILTTCYVYSLYNILIILS